MEIPFNQEFYSGNELKYIKEVLKKGHSSGDGYFTKKVSEFLQKQFSINKVLMTTSGSHALELATMIIDLKSGDEVIMPSYTFPSTANSVLMQKAKPVFVEIKEETYNIAPEAIERNISAKTKAIVPVHYGGISCEMDTIMEIAELNNIIVIEDAAQAVNAKYKNKYLGSWGHLGCYSFHASKNYICGEGGALTINIEDEQMYKKAERIREKGTNRTEFLKGNIDKYTWVDTGSSYLPSEILMAFLYAQFQKHEMINKLRKQIFDYYYNNLSRFLRYDFLKGMTYIPENCQSNYHLFFLRFVNGKIRDKVMSGLQKKGVSATFHYLPLHLSPQGKKLGYKKGDLPQTEKLADTVLRLPLYTGMKAKEREFVVNQVINVLEKI